MMRKALSPIRRRIRLTRLLRGAALGLLAGALFCLALSVASFFVAVEGVWRFHCALLAGGPALLAAVCFLWPVPTLLAAKRADACGLKERAHTALLLESEQGAMAALQRRDALAQLRALPLREAMPVRLPKRRMLAALAAALAAFGLLLVPNPQNDILTARDAARQRIRTQADTLEKAANAQAEEGMTKEELQALRKITGDMARDLRAAKDEREALLKLGEGEQALEKLQADMSRRIAREAAQALAGQPALGALAQALEAGNAEAARQALEGLAEGDPNALSEQLAGAASALPSGALSSLMLSASQLAASGDLSQALALLGSLQEAQPLTGTNMAALAQLARAGVLGQSGADGRSGQGTLPGHAPYSGTGSAGAGISSLDAGYSPGYSQSDQGDGTKPSEYILAEYERIYDPSRIGGDADPSQVAGQRGEGSASQAQLGPGMGDLSGHVPYISVIGEYRDSAAEAMQRTVLPAAMQEWVNRYFDALVDY